MTPLATVADVAQVEAIRGHVQGRTCVIVGAAPLRAPVPLSTSDVVVAINGAISSVPRVDLWFLGSKESDKPGDPFIKPLHRQMLEQARNRQAGHVVLLRGPKRPTEHYTLGWLSKMQCTVQTWSVLDKPTKRHVERELCARKHDTKPCSSGILAVACALWCGAESVRLEGFSFLPGYHYIQEKHPPSWWRDHCEADRRAVKALSARYGDRLSGDLIAQAVAA